MSKRVIIPQKLSLGNYMKISDFLLGRTNVTILNKSLDAYALRQKSIADNIANVDTPGYKRSAVSFEEDLKNALDKSKLFGYRTHPNHLPIGRQKVEDVEPIAYIPKDDSIPSGKNNVNIDKEMAELAKNDIRFNFAARMLEGTFKRLKSAIRGEPVQ